MATVKKGDSYKLYRLTSGTFASPVFTNGEVKGVGDLAVAFDPADIEVPERGTDTGHLQGHKDPAFNFTLFVEKSDTNVSALITAMESGDPITLAVADDTIATSGTRYLKMECCLFGTPLTVNRGTVASYEVVARRHADSDYTLTAVTV